MLGALLGASALGSLLGYHGQQETNRSNETMANNATAANMAEADRNRQFQQQEAVTARAFEERMSNTAYQRAREDMIKAGINPILAQAPASTPSSPSPSGSTGSAVTAQMQNPAIHLTGAFNSALDAMKTLGEVDLQKIQGDLIKAQTAKTMTDTKVSEKDIPKSEMINEGYRALKGIFRSLLPKNQGANQSAAQKFIQQNKNPKLWNKKP